jgi:hypothetical protein
LPPVSRTPVAKLSPVSMTMASNLPPVTTTPAANFATSSACVVDTDGKLPLVSTTLVANLPPVSTTPVKNNGTISGCRHLKVNLKAKIYIYVNSSTQRCPNKIINFFLIEDFSICHKIRNGPNGILRGLGETDHEKNQESKISWNCPFKDRSKISRFVPEILIAKAERSCGEWQLL